MEHEISNNTIISQNLFSNQLKNEKNTLFYSDLDITSIQLVKKSLVVLELDQKFLIETQEILYKRSIFYEKVRIKLEPNRLLSYDTKFINTDKSLLFILDFNQLTMGIAIKKRHKKFGIIILGSNKEFHFKALNYELFEKFLLYLNYFINNSRGRKENLLSVSLIPNFYQVK